MLLLFLNIILLFFILLVSFMDSPYKIPKGFVRVKPLNNKYKIIDLNIIYIKDVEQFDGYSLVSFVDEKEPLKIENKAEDIKRILKRYEQKRNNKVFK